jgi:hypothetical protein
MAGICNVPGVNIVPASQQRSRIDVLRYAGRVESNWVRGWDHPASLRYDRSRIFNRQFTNPRIHPMPFSMSQASLPSFEISLASILARTHTTLLALMSTGQSCCDDLMEI